MFIRKPVAPRVGNPEVTSIFLCSHFFPVSHESVTQPLHHHRAETPVILQKKKKKKNYSLCVRKLSSLMNPDKQAFYSGSMRFSPEPNQAAAGRAEGPQLIAVRCRPASKTTGTAARHGFIHASTPLRCAAPG